MRKSIIRLLSIILGMVIICFTVLKITDVISSYNSNQIEETIEDGSSTLENVSNGNSQKADLSIASSSQVSSLGYSVKSYSMEVAASGTLNYYASGSSSPQTYTSNTSINVHSYDPMGGTTTYFCRYKGAAALGFTGYTDWTFWNIVSSTNTGNYPGSIQQGGASLGASVNGQVMVLRFGVGNVVANTTLDIAQAQFNIDSTGYVTMTPANLSASQTFYVTSSGSIQTSKPTTPAITTYYSVSAVSSSSSQGSVTANCTTATIGTAITVNATPTSNYDFSYWSINDGGTTTTSTSKSTTYTLKNGNVVFTAYFKLKQRAMTTGTAIVNNSGVYQGSSGGGTITSVSGLKDYGTKVTLTATPASGYVFMGFSSSNNINGRLSTASSYTYTYSATSPTNIYALFCRVSSVTVSAVIRYNSTTLTGTPGTITGAGSGNNGSTTTLTATAATGYTFKGFSTSNTGSSFLSTSSSYTYTFGASNQTLYAIFEPVTTTLTTAVTTVYNSNAISADGGTVTTGGSGYYGSTTRITATPATGYTFKGFSTSRTGGTYLSTSSTYTYTFGASNQTIYAIFEPVTTTLTTATSAVYNSTALSAVGGSVTAGGSSYYNTTKEIIATPYLGYSFKGFSYSKTGGNYLSTASTYKYIYGTSNQTIYAIFEPVTSYLTTEVSTVNGTVVLSAVGGSVTAGAYGYYGSTKSLTAKANTGYEFVGFSTSRTGTPNLSTTSSYTYTYGTSNQTVYAIFKPVTTTLTTQAVIVNTSNVYQGTGGGSVTAGGSSYYNTTKSLTATANTGYEFVGFSTSNTGTPNLSTTSPYTYTYGTSNQTVYAIFKPITHSVVVTSSGVVTGSGNTTATATATYSVQFGLGASLQGYTLTSYTLSKYASGAQYSLNGSTWVNITSTTLPAGTKYVRNLSTTKNDSVTVTCNFSRNSYTRSVVSSNTTFGTASITYGTKTGTSYSVLYGDAFTLKAVEKTGYKFDGWYDNNGRFISSSLEYTVTGTNNLTVSNITYTARFSQRDIHVSSSFTNSESNQQFNNLKDAIAYATKNGIDNIFLQGDIGSLYQNYNTFVNQLGNYITYNSTKTLTITGLGNQNIIYNNSANCMIDVKAGKVIFNNVTINGTGINNVSGNRDNALLRLSGGNLELNNSLITNSYNIGSGIHYVGDWCPGVIDVYSGILTLDNTTLSGNTTTYGGDIFLHGGSLVMRNNSTIVGSYASGIYAVGSSKISINNSDASSIYMNNSSVLDVANLTTDVSLYKAGCMSVNSVLGNTDQTSASHVLGISGSTNLKGSYSNGNLIWANDTTSTKTKLELAILAASGKYTITLGESISLASALGKYVHHVSGCLSIGSVSVENNKALITGTGKRAVITGTEVGEISVTLYNIRTRGCYYYGTTTITEPITITINVLPRIGEISAGSDVIGIDNCTEGATYELYDAAGTKIKTLTPTLDSATGEYCILFEDVTANSKYTIKVSKNGYTSEQTILTSNKPALQTAIENATGFYINVGETTSLSTILGRTVRHLSGCITVSNVVLTTNSNLVSLTSNGKYSLITGRNPGYVDITLSVATRGWCAVYGRVSEPIDGVTIRVYILPTISNPIITTTTISNLPSNYQYSTDGGVTFESVTSLSGFIPGTINTIYVKYDYTEDGISNSLIIPYTFTTLIDSTSTSSMVTGINNKIESLKDELDNMNLSSDTYNKINEILDKYQEAVSSSLSKEELAQIDKAIDALYETAKESSQLELGEASSEETVTKLEEYLTDILDKASTGTINDITNTIISNANLVENVETNKQQISDVLNNNSSTLEDYNQLVDNYTKLTEEEKSALVEEFNGLLDSYKTKIEQSIADLNLTIDEINSYVENVEASTNVLEVYNELTKAQTHANVNDTLTLHNVSKDVVSTVLESLESLDNTSSKETVVESTKELYNSALDLIYISNLNDFATNIGSNITALDSYAKDSIIENIDGTYKYNNVNYNTYDEAISSALLDDQKTLVNSKIDSLINSNSELITSSTLDTEIKEELTNKTTSISTEAKKEINLATSVSSVLEVLTDVTNSLALQESKLDSIAKIEENTSVALDSYKDYSSAITTALESNINETKTNSIKNILNSASISANTSELASYDNYLANVETKVENALNVENKYNNTSITDSTLKGDLDELTTSTISTVLDNDTTLLKSYQETLDYNTKVDAITTKDDSIKNLSEIKDVAKEKVLNDYANNIDELYNSAVEKIINLDINSSTILDDIDSILNDTTEAIELEETKSMQHIQIVSEKQNAIISINNFDNITDDKKQEIISELNEMVSEAIKNLNDTTSTLEAITVRNETVTSINTIKEDVTKLIDSINTVNTTIDSKLDELLTEEIKSLVNDIISSKQEEIINSLINGTTDEVDYTTIDNVINAAKEYETYLDNLPVTTNDFTVADYIEESLNKVLTGDIASNDVKTTLDNLTELANIEKDKTTEISNLGSNLVDPEKSEFINDYQNQIETIIFEAITDVINNVENTIANAKTSIEEIVNQAKDDTLSNEEKALDASVSNLEQILDDYNIEITEEFKSLVTELQTAGTLDEKNEIYKEILDYTLDSLYDFVINLNVELLSDEDKTINISKFDSIISSYDKEATYTLDEMNNYLVNLETIIDGYTKVNSSDNETTLNTVNSNLFTSTEAKVNTRIDTLVQDVLIGILEDDDTLIMVSTEDIIDWKEHDVIYIANLETAETTEKNPYIQVISDYILENNITLKDIDAYNKKQLQDVYNKVSPECVGTDAIITINIVQNLINSWSDTSYSDNMITYGQATHNALHATFIYGETITYLPESFSDYSNIFAEKFPSNISYNESYKELDTVLNYIINHEKFGKEYPEFSGNLETTLTLKLTNIKEAIENASANNYTSVIFNKDVDFTALLNLAQNGGNAGKIECMEFINEYASMVKEQAELTNKIEALESSINIITDIKVSLPDSSSIFNSILAKYEELIAIDESITLDKVNELYDEINNYLTNGEAFDEILTIANDIQNEKIKNVFIDEVNKLKETNVLDDLFEVITMFNNAKIAVIALNDLRTIASETYDLTLNNSQVNKVVNAYAENVLNTDTYDDVLADITLEVTKELANTNLDNYILSKDFKGTVIEDIDSQTTTILVEEELNNAKDAIDTKLAEITNVEQIKNSLLPTLLIDNPAILDSLTTSVITAINDETSLDNLTAIVEGYRTNALAIIAEANKGQVSKELEGIINVLDTVLVDSNKEIINQLIENDATKEDILNTVVTSDLLDETKVNTLINNLIDSSLTLTNKEKEEIKLNVPSIVITDNTTYEDILNAIDNLENNINNSIAKIETTKQIESLANLTNSEKDGYITNINNLATNDELFEEKISAIIDSALETNDANQSLNDNYITTKTDELNSLIISESNYTNIPETELKDIIAEMNSIVDEFKNNPTTILSEKENNFKEAFDKITDLVTDTDTLEQKYAKFEDAITDTKAELTSSIEDIKANYPDDYFDEILTKIESITSETVTTFTGLDNIKEEIIADITDLKDAYELVKVEINDAIADMILAQNSVYQEIDSLANVSSSLAESYKDRIEVIVTDFIEKVKDSATSKDISDLKGSTESAIANIASEANEYNYQYQQILNAISNASTDSYYNNNFGSYTNIDSDTYKDEIASILDETLTEIKTITKVEELEAALTNLNQELSDLKTIANSVNTTYTDLKKTTEDILANLATMNEVPEEFYVEVDEIIEEVLTSTQQFIGTTDELASYTTLANETLDALAKRVETIELETSRKETINEITGLINEIINKTKNKDTYLSNKEAYDNILANLDSILTDVSNEIGVAESEEDILASSISATTDINSIKNRVDTLEEIYQKYHTFENTMIEFGLDDEVLEAINKAEVELAKVDGKTTEAVVNTFNSDVISILEAEIADEFNYNSENSEYYNSTDKDEVLEAIDRIYVINDVLTDTFSKDDTTNIKNYLNASVDYILENIKEENYNDYNYFLQAVADTSKERASVNNASDILDKLEDIIGNTDNNEGLVFNELTEAVNSSNYEEATIISDKIKDLIVVNGLLNDDLGFDTLQKEYDNITLDVFDTKKEAILVDLTTAFEDGNNTKAEQLVEELITVNELYNYNLDVTSTIDYEDKVLITSLDNVKDYIDTYNDLINTTSAKELDLEEVVNKNQIHIDSYNTLATELASESYPVNQYDETLTVMVKDSLEESYEAVKTSLTDSNIAFVSASNEATIDKFVSDLAKYDALTKGETNSYFTDLRDEIKDTLIENAQNSINEIKDLSNYEDNMTVFDTIITNVITGLTTELSSSTDLENLVDIIKNNNEYIADTKDYAKEIDDIYTWYNSINETLTDFNVVLACDEKLKEIIDEGVATNDYSGNMIALENELREFIQTTLEDKLTSELSSTNENSMINQATEISNITKAIDIIKDVEEILLNDFEVDKNSTIISGLNNIILDTINNLDTTNVDKSIIILSGLVEQDKYESNSKDYIQVTLETNISNIKAEFDGNITNANYEEAKENLTDLQDLLESYNKVMESLDLDSKIDEFNSSIVATLTTKGESLNTLLETAITANSNVVEGLIDELKAVNELYNDSLTTTDVENKIISDSISIVETSIKTVTANLINEPNTPFDSYIAHNTVNVASYHELVEAYNTETSTSTLVVDLYDNYLVTELQKEIEVNHDTLISLIYEFGSETTLTSEVQDALDEFNLNVSKYDSFVENTNENYADYISDIKEELDKLAKNYAKEASETIISLDSNLDSYNSYVATKLVLDSYDVALDEYDLLIQDVLAEVVSEHKDELYASGLYHDEVIAEATSISSNFSTNINSKDHNYQDMYESYEEAISSLDALQNAYEIALDSLDTLNEELISSDEYALEELTNINNLVEEFKKNDGLSFTQVDLALANTLEEIESLPKYADLVISDLENRIDLIIDSEKYNSEEETVLIDLINNIISKLEDDLNTKTLIDSELAILETSISEVKESKDLAIIEIQEYISSLDENEYLKPAYDSIVQTANSAISSLNNNDLTSTEVNDILSETLKEIALVETITDQSFTKLKGEALDSLEEYKNGSSTIDEIVDTYISEIVALKPTSGATKDSITDKYTEALDSILAAYQEELLSDIEEVNSNINLDDYYTLEQEEISLIIKDYQDSLENTTKAEDLKNYINDLSTKLDEVLTKVEVEINNGKDSLDTMLNEALESTNPDVTDNLSLEQKNELKDYVEELKNNITGSTLEEVSISVASETNKFTTKLEELKNDFIINNINEKIDEFISIEQSGDNYETLKEEIEGLISLVTGDKTNLKEDEFNLVINKNEALAKIEEYLDSLMDYSNYNQETITDLVNEAIIDITNATSITNIDSILEELDSTYKNIPTSKEEELSTAKEAAKNYLDKFNNGSETLLEVINNLKNQIDSVLEDNISDIENIISEGVATIYETIINDMKLDYSDSSADAIFNQTLEQLNDCTKEADYKEVISSLTDILTDRDEALDQINDYYNNGLELSEETLALITEALESIKEKITIDSINISLNYNTALIDKQILADEKVKAINEINDKFASYDEEFYLAEQYQKIEDIKNKAIEDINKANNLTSVSKLKNECLSNMDSIESIVDTAIDSLEEYINSNSSDELKDIIDSYKGTLESITIGIDNKYDYNGNKYDSISEIVDAMINDANTEIVNQLKLDAIKDAIQKLNDYNDYLTSSNKFSDKAVTDLNTIVNNATVDLNAIDLESLDFYTQVENIYNEAITAMNVIRSEFTMTKDQNISRDPSDVNYPTDYNFEEGLWGNVIANDDVLSLETILVVEKQKETNLNIAIETFNTAKDSYENTSVDLAKSEIKELLDIYLVDDVNNERIKISQDGLTYTVRILIPTEYQGTRQLAVVHIKDDGSLELFDTIIDGNFLVFTTTHFSDYALIGMTPLEQAREETSELVLDMLKELEQSGSLYTHDQWTTIKEIYTETLKQLQDGTITAPDMERIVIQLQELINQVPTELEQTIDDALTSLEEEFNSYNPNDYTEEEYQKIVDAYNQAKEDILNADSVEKVESIKEEARAKFTSTITIFEIVRNVIIGVIIAILGIFLILFLFYFKVIIYDFEDEVVYTKRTFFLFKVKADKLSITKEGYILEGIYFDKEYKDIVKDFRMPFGRAKLYANFVLNLDEFKYKKIDVKEEVITNSFTKEVLETPVVKTTDTNKPIIKVEESNTLEETTKYNSLEEYDDSEDLELDLKQKELNETAKDKVILKDYNVLVNYTMSFEAKLALGEDELRDYYNQIKNKILSYQVKARMSFKKESFYLGRKNLIVLNSRGKTLKAYIALSYDYCLEKKVRAFEATEKFAVDNNLTLVKISSNLQLKKFIDLIDDLMTQNEIGLNESYNAKDYTLPYLNLTKEQLIDMGKIKVYQSKSYKDVNVYEVNNLMSDEELANVEIIEEETFEIKGQKGIINIDTISSQFNDGDIVDLISLKEKKLIGKNVGYVKVLARGTLDKSLTVKANAFSKDAMKMIILTGGKVVLTVKEN